MLLYSKKFKFVGLFAFYGTALLHLYALVLGAELVDGPVGGGDRGQGVSQVCCQTVAAGDTQQSGACAAEAEGCTLLFTHGFNDNTEWFGLEEEQEDTEEE